MKSGLKVRIDKTNDILAALSQIGRRDVLIGIPEDASQRDDSGFSNAAIGYINENGSPAQNIPPRPHLAPGVKSVHAETTEQLRLAAIAVLNGKQGQAETHLGRAGVIASNAVKRYITAGGLTPLASSTLSARSKRGRTGAMKELARRKDNRSIMEKDSEGGLVSNANANPLVDTGEYRRAITYIVRDKNAKT